MAVRQLHADSGVCWSGTYSLDSQRGVSAHVSDYPAYSLAVPSLCHTTLQELVLLHPKQQGWGGPHQVRWSESKAAVMIWNLLIYSQKLFKAILEPFA